MEGALIIIGGTAQTRASTEVREELSAIPIDALIKSGPSKTWGKKQAVEAICDMEKAFYWRQPSARTRDTLG